MSHFSVLIVHNEDQSIEDILFPYWELDLSEEEMKTDKRAKFNLKHTRESAEQERLKIIEELREKIKNGNYKTREILEKEAKKDRFSRYNPEEPMSENYGTKEYYEKQITLYEKMNEEEFMKDWDGYSFNKEENGYGYYNNPNAKWDWWLIGGRWTGFFKLKDGSTGIIGEPGVMTPEAKEGYADQAYKKDIDFQFMIEKKKIEAAEKYDRLSKFLDGEIEKLKYTWKEVLRGERFEQLEIDEKRAVYHAQKPLEEIKSIIRGDKLSQDDRSFLTWLDYEDYQFTRDEFIARAGRSAISTFAVILNGKWYQRGEMGWWGCVSDEKDQDEWNEEFDKLVMSIPDDTLLTVVDCHI